MVGGSPSTDLAGINCLIAKSTCITQVLFAYVVVGACPHLDVFYIRRRRVHPLPPSLRQFLLREILRRGLGRGGGLGRGWP